MKSLLFRMQDHTWLDDWLDELQTKNVKTAVERDKMAIIEDNPISIEQSINSIQNDNNVIDACFSTASGVSYIAGASNEIVAPNNFQDVETSLNNREKTSDLNNILASEEPNVIGRNGEKKTRKILKQANKTERRRKRRYRQEEMVLFNRLRELLPGNPAPSKHQLLIRAISEIENLRALTSRHKHND